MDPSMTLAEMLPDAKIGDQVRCSSTPPDGIFKVGEEYTVGEGYNGKPAIMRAHPRKGATHRLQFLVSRFEPVDVYSKLSANLDKAFIDGALKDDVVVKPAHYTRFAIEPITFIMRNKMEFWRGNPIKYISRAGHKVYDGMTPEQSEKTDIQKAIRMLEMRLQVLDGDTSTCL